MECSNGIHDGKNWHLIRISRSGGRQNDLSNRWNEDQRKYSLLRRTWWLVLSMECIPSKLGQDWWNETLMGGMNLKHLSLVYRPQVCCLCLVAAAENILLQFVFWSLHSHSKTCLFQKQLPLRAVKAMFIFHVHSVRWCLYSCNQGSS